MILRRISQPLEGDLYYSLMGIVPALILAAILLCFCLFRRRKGRRAPECAPRCTPTYVCNEWYRTPPLPPQLSCPSSPLPSPHPASPLHSSSQVPLAAPRRWAHEPAPGNSGPRSPKSKHIETITAISPPSPAFVAYTTPDMAVTNRPESRLPQPPRLFASKLSRPKAVSRHSSNPVTIAKIGSRDGHMRKSYNGGSDYTPAASEAESASPQVNKAFEAAQARKYEEFKKLGKSHWEAMVASDVSATTDWGAMPTAEGRGRRQVISGVPVPLRVRHKNERDRYESQIRKGPFQEGSRWPGGMF